MKMRLLHGVRPQAANPVLFPRVRNNHLLESRDGHRKLDSGGWIKKLLEAIQKSPEPS
jgi:hypothetical protein